MSYKDILERIKIYLLLFAILFICAMFFLTIEGKKDSFLFLNGLHTDALDVFFKYFTNAGDGLFAVLLSILFFCFIRLRFLSVVMIVSYAASGLLAQLIKHLVESPRPKLYFNNDSLLHIVDGISLMGSNSFPSGHTTTAFALATVASCFTGNKYLQVAFLFAAALVGFSRIYLSQHFLADVLAGALIGLISAVLSCKILSDTPLFKKFKS